MCSLGFSLMYIPRNTTPTLHSSKHPNPTPRVVSHSSVTATTNDPAHLATRGEGHRVPRHSFPLSTSPNSPAPLIQLQSPFEERRPADAPPTARPPPLPIRKSGIATSGEHTVEHERSGSSESTESATTASSASLTTVVSPPPRPPSHHPPPRPPPRPPSHNPPSRPSPRPQSAATLRQVSPASHSLSASSPSGTPPPLPARRSTAQSPDDSSSRRAPPPRHHTVVATEGLQRTNAPAGEIKDAPTQESPIEGPVITSPPPIQVSSVVLPTERKAFGSHRPPPTRTIALGDKLPPARRAPSGSSSEEEEDDVKVKVELLPDSSRASRKQPALDVFAFSPSEIYVPAYAGVAVASGTIVAAANGQHLRIYDLSESDAPIHDLDARALGMETKTKDFKVTCLEFRPSRKESDRGCFLWIGTKDGHLFELDIRAGLVIGMKLAAHSHTVTHMFRHGLCMLTLDETGKALVFSPNPQDDVDIGLAYTQPRIVRIADKQEFAKLLGGKLWTSTRASAGSNPASTSRGPIVRVYDIFTPGATGKSLLPTEHLGAVTSGTIMQTRPDHVYLGHEGGNVSIWALNTDDGLPACEEVVKVSTSDVLCLEGIGDRLWAGGRKGTIAAYDVTSKPWVMTNHWMAHQGLPVLKLAVDAWSIQKLGKLSVYSLGRDERIRFWDGLLGVDWIGERFCVRWFSAMLTISRPRGDETRERI